MSSATANSVPNPAPSLAIIVSRYNASITDRLVEGALEEFAARAGDPASVHVFDAPGSYELAALALTAAEPGRYRGIVALGCLVRGETRHDRYIADSVAHGLVDALLHHLHAAVASLRRAAAAALLQGDDLGLDGLSEVLGSGLVFHGWLSP